MGFSFVLTSHNGIINETGWCCMIDNVMRFQPGKNFNEVPELPARESSRRKVLRGVRYRAFGRLRQVWQRLFQDGEVLR